MTSQGLKRSLLIAVTVAGLVLLVGCTGLWSTGSLSGSVDGSSQLATLGKEAVVWHARARRLRDDSGGDRQL